ncbi:hypothetical protein HDV01_007554 [Terramyces sp. JEL0728]|nr:hypothetical protein HDV01_007554 [Terramyces sp. JEL0728]
MEDESDTNQKQFLSSFELFKRGMTLSRMGNTPTANLDGFKLSLERKSSETPDSLFKKKHPETSSTEWDNVIAYYEHLVKSGEVTRGRLYEQMEQDRYAIRDHMNANIKLQEQNDTLKLENEKLRNQLMAASMLAEERAKEIEKLHSSVKTANDSNTQHLQDMQDLQLALGKSKEGCSMLQSQLDGIPKSNYHSSPPWDLSLAEGCNYGYEDIKPEYIENDIWNAFHKYQKNGLLDIRGLQAALTSDVVWPAFSMKTMWIMLHQVDQTGQYVDINGFNKLWLFVHSMHVLAPKTNEILISDAIRIIKGYGFKTIWINRVINRTIGNPDDLTWDQLLQVSSILLCWWEVIDLKLSDGLALFEYEELMGIATKLLF